MVQKEIVRPKIAFTQRKFLKSFRNVAQPIKVTTWANKAMILIACHSKGWVSI